MTKSNKQKIYNITKRVNLAYYSQKHSRLNGKGQDCSAISRNKSFSFGLVNCFKRGNLSNPKFHKSNFKMKLKCDTAIGIN